MNDNAFFIDFKALGVETNLSPDVDWQQDILRNLKSIVDKNEAFAVQSSGSTGKPKRLIFSKEQWTKSAITTIEVLGLPKFGTALLTLPPTFVAGRMMLARAYINQMKLYCHEPSTKIKVPFSVDFSALTPLQVENSFNEMEMIKTLIIGGAAISKDLNRRLTKLSNNIYETYGMTETLTHIALRNVHDSHFQVLKGFDIRKGSKDELIIKTPYYSEEIITNDVVELLDEKSFKVLGRLDFIINSGGLKINPLNIEEKIEVENNIKLIISSLNNKKLGEKLVGVTTDINLYNQRNNWIEKLKNQLPKNQSPKEIIYLESIPLTVTQKVNRKLIKQMINENGN